jgi:hypothetical protein
MTGTHFCQRLSRPQPNILCTDSSKSDRVTRRGCQLRSRGSIPVHTSVGAVDVGQLDPHALRDGNTKYGKEEREIELQWLISANLFHFWYRSSFRGVMWSRLDDCLSPCLAPVSLRVCLQIAFVRRHYSSSACSSEYLSVYLLANPVRSPSLFFLLK